MKKSFLKPLLMMCLFLLAGPIGLFAQATVTQVFRIGPKHLQLPVHIRPKILEHILASQAEFLVELKHLIENTEADLLLLVDKNHPLGASYIPQDLISLRKDRAYLRNRKDLSLRRRSEQALQDLALAARKDGLRIVVSSSYRSYKYQKNLFARYCREYGEKTAATFSARQGTSQHQLGTAVDFGSIDDSFAGTSAGKWVKKNAGKYGWSLSFPRGYDSITGYVWESWHYRYIGVEACDFQKKWFNDIQQYMFEFIYAWQHAN